MEYKYHHIIIRDMKVGFTRMESTHILGMIFKKCLISDGIQESRSYQFVDKEFHVSQLRVLGRK